MTGLLLLHLVVNQYNSIPLALPARTGDAQGQKPIQSPAACVLLQILFMLLQVLWQDNNRPCTAPPALC
jgi:hypothetical protein